MDFDHDALVAFSKSFGLFYLAGFFLIVVVYAYWPSNKERFDKAADAILHEADKPWR